MFLTICRERYRIRRTSDIQNMVDRNFYYRQIGNYGLDKATGDLAAETRLANENYQLFKFMKRGEFLCYLKFFKALKNYLHPFPNDRLKYFIGLAKGKILTENVNSLFRDPKKEPERLALFDLWLEQAKIAGCYNTVRKDEEGYRLVSKDGHSEERFRDAWNRGWTIKYFMNNNYGPFKSDDRRYTGTDTEGNQIDELFTQKVSY